MSEQPDAAEQAFEEWWRQGTAWADFWLSDAPARAAIPDDGGEAWEAAQRLAKHHSRAAWGAAVERERARPVCDCHTWPNAKELHDYTVAVEQELERERGREEALARDAEALLKALGVIRQGPPPNIAIAEKALLRSWSAYDAARGGRDASA